MKYLLLLLPLLLSGCGASYVPIAGDLVGMADDSVVFIKDASIAKEAMVHQTLQNRDKEYGKAYKLSGTEIKFAMKEVMPGIWLQVIESVASKAPPEFAGDLPTAPSVHPVWAAVGKGLDVAAKVSLFWIGAEALTTMWERSAPQYNGPYQSYNQTAEPYIVEPLIVKPEIVRMETPVTEISPVVP